MVNKTIKNMKKYSIMFLKYFLKKFFFFKMKEKQKENVKGFTYFKIVWN